MKKIVFNITFLLFAVQLTAQQKLSTLERSPNPFMTPYTNAQRYMAYGYYTTVWGDTLRNFIQTNPYWLGTQLPLGNVPIAAAGNSLTFSQGGVFRWLADTTAGDWIPHLEVNPTLSSGLMNYRLIGVGANANKYIGLSAQNGFGLYMDGYPDLYLRNDQVQDASLAPGNYYTRINETGKITFVPLDSLQYWLKTVMEAGNNVNIQTENELLIESNDAGVIAGIDPSGNNTLGGVFWAATTDLNTFSKLGIDALIIRSEREAFVNQMIEYRPEFMTSTTIYTPELDDVIYVENVKTTGTGGTIQTASISYVATENHTSGTNRGTKVVIGSTSVGEGVENVGFVVDGENLVAPFYDDARNDTEIPTNFYFSKDADGTQGVKQLSSVFSALSAQNTGDQILTTAVNNALIFDNISFTSGANITITNDTIINFLSLGVYEVSVDGRFESSASAEPTSVQFTQVGSGIADLGANFLFSITTDDQVTPFKRIFQVTSLPAAIIVYQEATTWSSGSVLFSATSSLNAKRLY